MYLVTVLLEKRLKRVLENFLVPLICCNFFFFNQSVQEELN